LSSIEDINISKLLRFTVFKDSRIFVLIGIYGIIITILNLALPLAIQNLIGTIVYSALIQPIIIVSIILVFVLSFSSILSLLQKYLIEIYYRASFVRLSSELLLRALYADYQSFNKRNTSDLSARYFDIFNIQNAASSLVTEGLLTVLQIVVSCTLLSFYHPYLLLLSVICLLSIYLTWMFFSKAAIRYAIYNSEAKYGFFAWLNDIFKMNYFFKSEINKNYALEKGSDLIDKHIKTRKKYWNILFIQFIILSCVYLALTMALFTGGSILVVQGQLTLGQLVASEIIFTGALIGVAKLPSYFDGYFKLIAASEEMSHAFDIKLENNVQQNIIKAHDSLINHHNTLELSNLEIKDNFGGIYNFNLAIKTGSSNLIMTANNDCECILMELIMGFVKPIHGTIEFEGLNYLDYDQQMLRDKICLVKSVYMFGCTLKDFLFSPQSSSAYTESKYVLDKLGVTEILNRLPNGLNTHLIGNGYPLRDWQIVLLKLAKGIISKPKVLLINQEFDKLNKDIQKKVLDYIINETNITFIHFSNNLDLYVNYNSFIFLLHNRTIYADNFNQFKQIVANNNT
jgi:putative ABC transport system ATP-binding protein